MLKKAKKETQSFSEHSLCTHRPCASIEITGVPKTSWQLVVLDVCCCGAVRGRVTDVRTGEIGGGVAGRWEEAHDRFDALVIACREAAAYRAVKAKG